MSGSLPSPSASNTCSAPWGSTGVRCHRNASGRSQQCAKHRPQCHALHDQYKAACAAAKAATTCPAENMATLTTNQLLKRQTEYLTALSMYQTCIKTRTLHNRKCVVRECRDQGHAQYVSHIRALMTSCSATLDQVDEALSAQIGTDNSVLMASANRAMISKVSTSINKWLDLPDEDNDESVVSDDEEEEEKEVVDESLGLAQMSLTRQPSEGKKKRNKTKKEDDKVDKMLDDMVRQATAERALLQQRLLSLLKGWGLPFGLMDPFLDIRLSEVIDTWILANKKSAINMSHALKGGVQPLFFDAWASMFGEKMETPLAVFRDTLANHNIESLFVFSVIKSGLSNDDIALVLSVMEDREATLGSQPKHKRYDVRARITMHVQSQWQLASLHYVTDWTTSTRRNERPLLSVDDLQKIQTAVIPAPLGFTPAVRPPGYMAGKDLSSKFGIRSWVSIPPPPVAASAAQPAAASAAQPAAASAAQPAPAAKSLA